MNQQANHPSKLLLPRLSIMMFLQFAIWGAWLPILYPFLLGYREFTLTETGLCLSAGAVGAIFGPFIAGQLADRVISTEKLLAISHLIGAVLVYMLGTSDTFMNFAILSGVYGFVYAPTIALTNSLAFHHLPNRDRDFGKVRLWGTVGWIVAGIAVGQYLRIWSTPVGVSIEEITAVQNAGRSIAFTISAVLGIVMGFYCLTLPHTPPSTNQKSRFAWLETLREIRMQPLVTLFIIAVPVSIIHQFYFVYTSDFVTGIQNTAGSDAANLFANGINTVLGVGGGGLMTIGQMSEILVLACMPFLAVKFSKKTLLCTGLVAYGLRMAIFAYFPTLVPVVIGVALHGICFGCFIFVAFMVVDEFCSTDVRATAQNFFNLVIVGVGIIVGSLFATALVGEWAMVDGEMDYSALFLVPMWLSLACFLMLLVFYPNLKELQSK
ncbi:MAG TPA: MFS transporter [Phycisphaerales bacterium]|nr:MFS transporter [Phycisphaerales bacterium]HIB51260.1 MFS transporter [Phycisphaerales bacterium]HIN83989.1 MFS transporter [Phycisphaerales bacterium]HIO20505.1 MFS transporter [Phycisphaerales bacterium]HIO52713.1 MFS transporter [Phycisphaerales bacterium]